MQLCKIWRKQVQGGTLKQRFAQGLKILSGEREHGCIPPQHPLSPEQGLDQLHHSLAFGCSSQNIPTPPSEIMHSPQAGVKLSEKENQTEQRSVEEEGRGGQGNVAPVTQRGLESFCSRVEKPRAIPTPSQGLFSWKIYSSELIVWLGTMVRMLPCKLNNSCPLFNLFDLDCSNLLCALELF